MGDEMIYYWKNRLNNEKKVNLSISDYIVHLFIANQISNEGINEWINCDTFNKLKSFIIYVILPSCEVSRALAKVNDNHVCVDGASYNETLELLSFIDEENEILMEEYKIWYDMADSCNDGDLGKLQDLVVLITERVQWEEGVIVGIEVFENVKVAGKSLITAYEEEGLVDILEEEFKLPINEIRNIFEDVDKNEFFLKRVMDILNNLNIF